MKKYINIAIGCVIGLFVLYTFYYLYQQAQPKVKVYEVLAPEKRDIVKTSVASGKVEPRDEVNIKPQIQGIITELYVEAGNKVKQNDPIAKVAVIPDMAQLNNAQSNVRTAQLTLEETEREHSRLKTLHEKGLVSHEDFEKSQNALDKAIEARHAAQDQLDIVTDGISKRSGKINTTIVRSTISGTILEVPVKIGTSVINANSFNEGTTVATVADMGNIIFRGNIDETEVGRLRQGMHIDLTIGAIQGVTLPATLEPRAMVPFSSRSRPPHRFPTRLWCVPDIAPMQRLSSNVATRLSPYRRLPLSSREIPPSSIASRRARQPSLRLSNVFPSKWG